jgi:rare lipoprotein A
LFCGLLLSQIPSTGWAADKKVSAKPANSRQVKKAAKKRTAPVPPSSEFGAADVLEEKSGLHGHASFYGKGFQGRKTSTGERFDIKQFTAASNHFPLGTLVAVRRVDNDRCAIVKVNDRMHARHVRRVIDVSHAVAEYLDMLRAGVVLVRVAPLKAASKSEINACRAAFEPDAPCESCQDSQIGRASCRERVS